MRKPFYFWLANLVLVIHFCFAAFVLIGWYFPNISGLYYVAMASWFYSWFILGFCPLTKWEFILRKNYDDSIDVNQEMIQYQLRKHFAVDVAKERILFLGGLVWVTLLGLSLWLPY